MIKKIINLITIEEKIVLKNYAKKNLKSSNEIINYEEKEMIPLTKEEKKSYQNQEACHICKEKFLVDKDDKDYINRKRLNIIFITRENLEELLIANAT